MSSSLSQLDVFFLFCLMNFVKLVVIYFFFMFWTAENDPHDGKRKCEALWPIFKIAHQKSRYIFDLYHRRKEISKELYEFCLEQGYADRNLIAKWKKVCLTISNFLNVLVFEHIFLLWFYVRS